MKYQTTNKSNAASFLRSFLLVSLLGILGPAHLPVAAAASIRQVSLTANNIVYDSTTNKIYASVPSSAGSIGNTITLIDPDAAVVGDSIFIGSEPGQLAISDDGQFVYAAINGSSAVARFDTATETRGLLFSLGSPLQAEDMQVQPGHPHTIAVSKRDPRFSPHTAGTYIFDDGVYRTNAPSGLNTIAFSAAGDKLYGYFNEVSSFEFSRFAVDANGLSGLSSSGNLISGYGLSIRTSNGLLFVNNGEVIDPEAQLQLGTFSGVPYGAPMLPDAANGVVYFVSQSGSTITLLEYDPNTFRSLGSIVIPGVSGGVFSLIKWGANGLAFNTSGGQVYLIGQLTRTILSSSANASLAGQSVTLTASVTTGSGTPTGTVTFRDGGTILGSMPLDGTGKAALTTSSLSIGSHLIQATYSGDSSFATSTSASLNQQVNAGMVTQLQVTAPSSSTTGIPFNITVTAQNQYNTTVTGYTGAVKLTSTDGSAVLPGLYPFTSGDAGVHNFSVTLQTAGSQMVTATDTQNAINGSAAINVTPPVAPAGLAATPGDGLVSLTWTASAGATGYRVKRSTTSGGPYTIVFPSATTGFTDTGLADGTSYYYVVSAVNGPAEGPNSTEVVSTPRATWLPLDLCVGSDNQVRLLWNSGDGRLALWTVGNDGNFTSSNGYGPYAGWSARAAAAGGDALTRVLWNKNDGTAALWLLGANNAYQASFGYGPYPGWTAVDIAVGTDNKTRILWTNVDGRTAVWTVDSTGSFTSSNAFGPYTGFTARAISSGPDGLTRVLWNKANGMAALWLLGPDNSYLASFGYGPYPGWSLSDVTVGSDNKARLLWTYTDGSIVTWSMDSASGSVTNSAIYGPYSGFTPARVAAGTDSMIHVLWNNTNDTAALWLMGMDNSYQASFGYGPF